MKKQALICACSIASAMAFGGRLSNLLESGTITGNGTAYSFGFGGAYKSGGGTYNTFVGIASQSAQTGLAWIYVPNHQFFDSIPISPATLSVSSTYKVLWTETVANEGLPAHLYAKLNLVSNESGIETMSPPSPGSHGNFLALNATMKVVTSGGTGSSLPASTLTLPSGWTLPWSANGDRGAAGKQTVNLSPAWTLVNTNSLTGFRTWSASETIVSPVASSAITNVNIQGAVNVYMSTFASYSQGIFFDVTAS